MLGIGDEWVWGSSICVLHSSWLRREYWGTNVRVLRFSLYRRGLWGASTYTVVRPRFQNQQRLLDSIPMRIRTTIPRTALLSVMELGLMGLRMMSLRLLRLRSTGSTRAFVLT